MSLSAPLQFTVYTAPDACAEHQVHIAAAAFLLGITIALLCCGLVLAITDRRRPQW